MMNTKRIRKPIALLLLVVSMLFSAAGCQRNGESDSGGKDKLTGRIEIDGSSTVFPISAAVAEEFMRKHGSVEIGISQSGTGGGMKKFSSGEIDICNASRPIKQEEIKACKANGIEFEEFTVGYDGITVVVNKKNDWVDSMTVDDLRKLWQKDSTVKKWSDLNPKWPDKEIKLYGPGTDSGTFEFFTEKINGVAKSIRKDFTPSEDDNVLVSGVAADKYALGYFGFAYYAENQDKLKALKIDAGEGAVEPTFDTIKDGSYKPLSRPLFIYVNKQKAKKEHVREFLKFYFEQAETLVSEVGYVPLPDYTKEIAKIK